MISSNQVKRGLTSIEGSADASIKGLREKKNAKKDRLRQPVIAFLSLEEIEKQEKIGNCKKEKKQLYGFFKRQTNVIAREKTWIYT